MAQLVDLVGDGGALLLARPGRIRCRVVLAVGEILCAAFVSNLIERLVVLVQLVRQIDHRRCIEHALQALGHRFQRARNGVRAGREQLPQDEGDQLPLALRQRLQVGAAQVVGDEAGQFLLLV